MKRSKNSELAERINLAFTLLKEGVPESQIITHLMSLFCVSQIQAYRYVQQAKANKVLISIPETSVVFTVKMPPSIIKRIKSFANLKGMSISKVVRTALEDFLVQRDHGQKTKAN